MISGEILLHEDQNLYYDLCDRIPIMRKPSKNNFWLIVLRGNCTFTTKVRNAQEIGASLVIIADNLFEKSTHIIMADDGHASSIHIPSIFISKMDGDKIMDFLKM